MKDTKRTTVLDCVSVKAGHTHFISMPTQWQDMISDGSFAVARPAAVAALQWRNNKVPTFIKDAILLPIGEHNKDGLFKELCGYVPEKAIALELSPLLTPAKNKDVLMCRLDQVDGELRVFANVHMIKLLSEMFPAADWYAQQNSPVKPLLLVQDGLGVVALLMPIQSKGDVPGFSTTKSLNNTEILQYVLGWQGGTIQQTAAAIKAVTNGERERKGDKSFDTAELEQHILSASAHDMRQLVRYAQASRNTAVV